MYEVIEESDACHRAHFHILAGLWKKATLHMFNWPLSVKESDPESNKFEIVY